MDLCKRHKNIELTTDHLKILEFEVHALSMTIIHMRM